MSNLAQFGKRLFGSASAIWGGAPSVAGVPWEGEVDDLTNFYEADDLTNDWIAERI